MELAAGAGAVGEEGLKESDVGGDDERGVPVFGGKTVGLGFPGGVELRVMFENDVASEFLGQKCEHFAEDVGVLFDDAGERDNENDATMVVSQGVTESEYE